MSCSRHEEWIETSYQSTPGETIAKPLMKCSVAGYDRKAMFIRTAMHGLSCPKEYQSICRSSIWTNHIDKNILHR